MSESKFKATNSVRHNDTGWWFVLDNLINSIKEKRDSGHHTIPDDDHLMNASLIQFHRDMMHGVSVIKAGTNAIITKTRVSNAALRVQVFYLDPECKEGYNFFWASPEMFEYCTNILFEIT